MSSLQQSVIRTLLALAALQTITHGFAPVARRMISVTSPELVTFSRSALFSSGDESNVPVSPAQLSRSFLGQAAKGLSSMALSIVATQALLRPLSASAMGLEDANNKLANYEFPPILFVPPGFSPLVSEYGRGNIKEMMVSPILVQFCHPQLWVVQKTAVNNNGESGTIGANDYMKGDSAFLYLYPLPNGETLSDSNTKLVGDFLYKALTQKGDSLEGFKLEAVKPGVKAYDGTQYYTAYFKYQLNTEAGFLISRKGIASLTNVGPNVQGLVTLATDLRYKKLSGDLQSIVDSFRVYKLKSGVFSVDSSA